MMISRFDFSELSKLFMRALKRRAGFASFFLALPNLLLSQATAGEADIVGVEFWRTASGAITISATVAHADEGWEHYADSFVVRDEQDNLLGTRVLAHPHVNEQPFTRQVTLSNIAEGICVLTLAATDSVHQDGGKELQIDICAE